MFSRLPRFLVRFRLPLFILMTTLTVLSGLMIPRVNVNTDMTKYLPDSSPMKQGIDVVAAHSPALDEQVHSLGASFGNGEDLMPVELPKALVIGVSLAVVVLLVMCTSVMEVLLFLVNIGFAVVLNMGTNALLPSVSMLTNTLTAVLQMVLSMDYSIILMNRYRQEKSLGKAPLAAMEGAVGSAAPAILSSALTTVVSLLMLVFIRLKIGADLGWVLAKGVSFSLVCNFTVLPTLILWSDTAVEKTRKKIPVLPAAKMARFQYRFRIPIAVLFLAIFVASVFLQRLTPITFTPDWSSKATAQLEDTNPFMLVYATADEAAVPALLDSIAADPKVLMTASYPSLLGRPYTADGMYGMLGGFGADTAALPRDLLRVVYYARRHSVRDGVLSFREIEAAVDGLSARGLVPEGFDRAGLMQRLMPPAPLPVIRRTSPAEQPAAPPEPLEPMPEEESLPAADSSGLQAPVPDTTAVAESLPAGEDTLSVPRPSSRFSYEDAITPLEAKEMAKLIDVDRQSMTLFYRIADRARQKMTPVEAVDIVQNKLLGDRRYASFITPELREEFALLKRQLDSTLVAHAYRLEHASDALAAVSGQVEAADSLAEAIDTVLLASVEPLRQEEAAPVVEDQPEEEDEAPTPLEILADMALSPRRYPASRVYSVLSAAGIPVSRSDLDLLYLYALSGRDYDTSWTATPVELLDYVADTLLPDPAFSRFAEPELCAMVDSARTRVHAYSELMRGDAYSAAALVTDYIQESDETFDFVLRLRSLSDRMLPGPHYWIGESEMYKELKDSFSGELLLLTLLTILSIFLIVAVTFRSLLIPVPLIMTVLAGVYANVIAAGLGGHTLYYLSILIVQGILMGATIDYSILLTNYYRHARKTLSVEEALEEAYRGASHSILTSGLILTLVPFFMALVIEDAMMSMILRCLGVGAFSVLLLIIFFLPGVLALTDRIVRHKRSKP